MDFDYQLFDRLQAEFESDWLAQVFVRPENWSLLSGARSVVIYGAAGAGKSAVRLMLAEQGQYGPQHKFVINWSPEPLQTADAMNEVRIYFEQILDEAALSLTRYLCQYYDNYLALSPSLQSITQWLIQQHVRGDDLALRLTAISVDLPLEHPAHAFLTLLTNQRAPAVLPQHSPTVQIMAQFMLVLKALGFQGLWVMVDNLSIWLETVPERMSQALTNLLSCFGLLEQQGFAFKVFAPVELKAAINQSSGRTRYRVFDHTLVWSEADLVAIVLQRVRYGFGRHDLQLSDIYAEEQLLPWLTSRSAGNPRRGLELGQQLCWEWQRNGGATLTQQQWLDLAGATPLPFDSLASDTPLLHIDLTSRKVFVGTQEIDGLTGNAYKMLFFLYEHRTRICSHEELYYRVIRGLDAIPAKDREHWEEPESWKNNLDNVIYRLKKSIEPDAKNPVFVINERGKGYTLRKVR